MAETRPFLLPLLLLFRPENEATLNPFSDLLFSHIVYKYSIIMRSLENKLFTIHINKFPSISHPLHAALFTIIPDVLTLNSQINMWVYMMSSILSTFQQWQVPLFASAYLTHPFHLITLC